MHPLSGLNPFAGGIALRVVEPGTEIEHRGEKLTVTETEAVYRGHEMFLTQKHYDALKAHTKEAQRDAI